MKKLTVVPVVLLAVLAAGCGGSSTATGPTSASATSATSAATNAAPSAAPSTSASASSADSSASTTSTASAAADVCDRLTLAQVNELAGSSYTTQTKQSNRCTYGTGTDGLLTGIKETDQSLASLVASEKQALGGTSKPTTVDGAEDAAVVLAKDSNKNVVSLLAKQDGSLYLVIIEGSGSESAYTTSATKVIEALIAS